MSMTASAGTRQLRRNISNTSSAANNFGAAAALAVAATSSEQQAWPCSTLSPTAVLQREIQPSLQVLQAVQPVPQTDQLLLGTSAGLFLLDLQTQSLQLLGLQDTQVAHVSYSSGLVLASCPFTEDVNACWQQQADEAAAAGLYCLRLPASGSSSSTSGSCSPFASCSGSSTVPVSKLWDGNARCSAAAAAVDAAAAPRIYVGAQPADVLYSDDMGLTWESSGLAAAPPAGGWYRMLPPYEPSVRSICLSNGCSSSSVSSSGCAMQAEAPEQQQQQRVLVGVEVGGALAHTPGSPSSSSSDSDSLSSAAWDDCSQGLCRDVQALQADPFTPSKLYAVAGSGSLPGGLYRCRGKGQKWRRLFGYRYSVGMAVSPYSKGRLMLVSADKPPEIGCSLFESVDGGRHFVNVTDYIAEATASITEYAPGLLEHCPVVTYVPGGLVLGCVTGHVLMGTALPGGGFSSWQLLAKLPTAVHSMCMTQDGATPASIQRA